MDWKSVIITSTILCSFMEMTEGSNILVVMPLFARSHFTPFQPFLEKLIQEGHNLTIIAGYKLNNEYQSNYTLVNVRPVFSQWKTEVTATRQQNRLHHHIHIHSKFQEYLDGVLEYSDVQNLINSNDKYDLVIATMCYVDAIFAFGHKFNAPVITVAPHASMLTYNHWILGNPFPPSYFPSTFLPFTEQMSIWARIINAVHSFLLVLFYEFISLPKSQSQIEKYFHFEKENMPHIKDVINNVSVSLVTSHFAFGYPKPDLPNVVNVAGLHMTSPNPLSEEIQQFMDEAEHGVIYFSLGSFIEPNKLASLGETFIRVVENLPQRILMKWNSSLLSNTPKNVLVQNWISQEAVLNHPKCRLFITHGGMHSSFEALNASVPVIVIPFYADQHYNGAIMEYYKIGAVVEVDNFSTELQSKIEEILRSEKYKENMVKRSMIFRDRPKKPLETAMYWVDHVLKHGNIHLKSDSVKLQWCEVYSLEMLIILAVIFSVMLKIFGFIF